jgi:hypothetical protein
MVVIAMSPATHDWAEAALADELDAYRRQWQRVASAGFVLPGERIATAESKWIPILAQAQAELEETPADEGAFVYREMTLLHARHELRLCTRALRLRVAALLARR